MPPTENRHELSEKHDIIYFSINRLLNFLDILGNNVDSLVDSLIILPIQ